MAYEGNVALINGLIQANGQDFPLVHMDAVYVDDDLRLGDLLRELCANNPFRVTDLTITPAEVEPGEIVEEIIFSYSFSRIPELLIINGEEVEVTGSSGTYILTDVAITEDTVFTIEAMDSGNALMPPQTISETIEMVFKNRIYWGAAPEPAALTQSFIANLSESEISSEIKRTITVTAGADNYIWFAYPQDLGYPKFEVNGWQGGFVYAGTVPATNRKTIYRVYRSGKPNIGTVTANIS